MLKKTVILLILVFSLLSSAAIAQYDGNYLIPDSNTRRLTEAELWDYQYDALGYILNEIFARHSYHFERGGKYDQYFRSTSWYRESTRYATNEEIYKNEMTNIEWANESLVKKVRADMKALNTKNEIGMTLEDILAGGMYYRIQFDRQNGYFYGGQKLKVYNGPGWKYSRAAGGKAIVTTDEEIAVAGIENGYALVLYETKSGYRSGYVDLSELQYELVARHLNFDYFAAQIGRDCALTADPYGRLELGTVPVGKWVTWLAFCGDHGYIETEIDGEPMRGFIPATAIQ